MRQKDFEREQRLPKWAQDELITLRAQNRELQKALASFASGMDVGPFWLRDMETSQRFYLPARTWLTFGPYTETDTSPQLLSITRASLYQDELALRVSGLGRIKVLPEASNVVLIKPEA